MSKKKTKKKKNSYLGLTDPNFAVWEDISENILLKSLKKQPFLEQNLLLWVDI